MSSTITNVSDARGIIAKLKLAPYTKKALKAGKLSKADAKEAEVEYRQHLLLCWVNQQIQGNQQIVPTERADQIWHEHILDTKPYSEFCNQLYGEYLHHNPSLEKGSRKFNRAVEHTREVQSSVGNNDSFAPTMYAACGGFGGTTTKTTNASDAPSSTESGSGSGASCGGGSCGGGGGCGGGG